MRSKRPTSPARRRTTGVGIAVGLFIAVVVLAMGTVAAQTTTLTTPSVAPPTNSTIPQSDSRMTVTTDIVYYPGGPDLDAYIPTGGTVPRPALIMVHGGGWAQGDQSELAPWARQVAEQNGWAAFTVDYRLDLNDPSAWADELHDVQAAIRYIAVNASRWNLDTGSFMLMGDSAGANLVAVISSTGTADPVTGTAVGTDPSLAVPIVAVALWSPPTDLAALVPQGNTPPVACTGDPACDFLWNSPAIVDYIGCQPRACPQTYAEASPISWVDPQTAPSFVANGNAEVVPLAQVRTYIAALNADHVVNRFVILDTDLHATEYGAEIWPDTQAFLARQLRAAAPTTPTTDPTDRAAVDALTPAKKTPYVLYGAIGVGVLAVLVLVLLFVRRRNHRRRR